MNEKAQLDPYTIGGIAIAIFILVVVLPLIYDTMSDINCQGERTEIEKLRSKLSVCQ